MTETTNDDHDTSPSESEVKIIRQIEYYFSDYNLRTDKFLKEQIKLDDGWVPLDILIKFNRLKKMTTEFSTIITAIRKSSSNLLEINEEETKIRRSVEKPIPEFTEEYKQEIESKTVYVKPFPLDYEIEQVLEYFKKCGDIENAFMRRREKKFKGSVFVTFKTKTEAEDYVKLDSVKHNDTELLREFKSDYIKRKIEEKKQAKSKGQSQPQPQEDDNDVEIIKDSVLKFHGVSNRIKREQVKEAFSLLGPVAWIDFDYGDTKGFARFEEENSGKEIFDKVKEEKDGKITIVDSEVTIELVQGEEEIEYFKMSKAKKMQRRQEKRAGRRNKFKGNQGRRGGFRRSNRLSGGKRSADDNDGAPAAKQAKTE